AAAMAGLGLRGSAPGPEREAEAWGSRTMLDLLGGDPIQRVLAADALARPRATMEPRSRIAWLVGALEDEYPAVRLAATRAIRENARQSGDRALQEAIAAFDFLGPVDARLVVVDRLRELVGPGPLDAHPERLEALAAAQERQLIWIGE
ncbi:MAG: hypothetical protein KC420_20810, partial [Myxococcales bacterium]|nr:hypothetical protein [Myxococcales bacterium]